MISPCSILLVDDEVVICQSLGLVLSQHGFQVSSAKNGQKALERVRNEQPGVCIIDQNLPDMQGLELARHIFTIAPHIKIIMLSGYAEQWKEKELPSSIVAFLTKPVLIKKLLESLEKARNGKNI